MVSTLEKTTNFLKRNIFCLYHLCRDAATRRDSYCFMITTVIWESLTTVPSSESMCSIGDTYVEIYFGKREGVRYLGNMLF